MAAEGQSRGFWCCSDGGAPPRGRSGELQVQEELSDPEKGLGEIEEQPEVMKTEDASPEGGRSVKSKVDEYLGKALGWAGKAVTAGKALQITGVATAGELLEKANDTLEKAKEALRVEDVGAMVGPDGVTADRIKKLYQSPFAANAWAENMFGQPDPRCKVITYVIPASGGKPAMLCIDHPKDFIRWMSYVKVEMKTYKMVTRGLKAKGTFSKQEIREAAKRASDDEVTKQMNRQASKDTMFACLKHIVESICGMDEVSLMFDGFTDALGEQMAHLVSDMELEELADLLSFDEFEPAEVDEFEPAEDDKVEPAEVDSAEKEEKEEEEKAEISKAAENLKGKVENHITSKLDEAEKEMSVEKNLEADRSKATGPKTDAEICDAIRKFEAALLQKRRAAFPDDMPPFWKECWDHPIAALVFFIISFPFWGWAAWPVLFLLLKIFRCIPMCTPMINRYVEPVLKIYRIPRTVFASWVKFFAAFLPPCCNPFTRFAKGGGVTAMHRYHQPMFATPVTKIHDVVMAVDQVGCFCCKGTRRRVSFELDNAGSLWTCCFKTLCCCCHYCCCLEDPINPDRKVIFFQESEDKAVKRIVDSIPGTHSAHWKLMDVPTQTAM